MHEESADSIVRFVDDSGVESIYRSTKRDLRLRVSSLQVCLRYTDILGSKDTDHCAFEESVEGRATLEDFGIQIVGDELTKSTEVKVRFCLASNEQKEWLDSQKGPGKRVAFGFLAGSWEDGIESEWRFQCHISENQFHTLVDLVNRRDIDSAEFSVESPDLYLTHGYAPLSMKVDWFMKSDGRSGAWGHGRLTSFHVLKRGLDLPIKNKLTTTNPDIDHQSLKASPSPTPRKDGSEKTKIGISSLSGEVIVILIAVIVIALAIAQKI